MESVLVHHRRHARRADVPDNPESVLEVADAAYWSVWRQRHYPWALLEDGVPVVLLESWSSGGRLTWLVEAVDVLRATVESRAEMVDLVARWSGEPASAVADSEYVRGSAVEAGVVLGFRPLPLSWLGHDRPVELRLDRFGWALTRFDELASWGVDLRPSLSAAAR